MSLPNDDFFIPFGFFRISADSERIVFRTLGGGTTNVSGFREGLFSVSVDGGEVIKLNEPLVSGGDVSLAFFLGQQVVYLADQDIDPVLEVYNASFDGSGAVKINDDLIPGENIFGIRSDEDERRFVYATSIDERFSFFENLFSVELMDEEEFCFPIISSNSEHVVVCL